MDYNKKVSIIIPMYNAESSIKKCISSILVQADESVEIIVINDGSVDDSGNIVNSLKKVDSRILLIEQENRGVSAARNKGLEYAKGENIIFVDADDYLVEDSLKTRLYLASKADLLISDYSRDSGLYSEDALIYSYDNISITAVMEALLPDSNLGYQGYLWNKVFKKEIIDSKNIRFNEQISYGEDRLFIAEYVSQCKSILLDSNKVYHYSYAATGAMSLMKTIKGEYCSKIFSEVEGLEKFAAIVKEYDESLYQRVVYYEFVTCLNFVRFSEKKLVSFREKCIECAREKLLEIFNFSITITPVQKKIEAILRYIIFGVLG